MVHARRDLIDSLAPGIVQGEGVFETMRVVNGHIFALEEHFNRLWRGLKLLNMRSPYTQKQWRQTLQHTIKLNGFKNAQIRLAIWNENEKLRIAIVCRDIKNHWSRKYKQGIKAVVTSVKRNKMRTSNIKSMDYGCFRQAYEEAQRKGFDEGILLNNRREVVEGSRTNVFYVRKGILYTPAVKCGCLNGITRKIILQNARQLGIAWASVYARVSLLMQADEVFVTNSLVGVMPVTAINDKIIGTGKTGPVTNKLWDAYCTNVHLSCPPLYKSV